MENCYMHAQVLTKVHETILFLKELAHLSLYLKLWNDLSSCMFIWDHVHEIWFEIGFNWNTLGLWFIKLIFETCNIMGFEVFSRKLAQEDRIWCIKTWFWAWGSNLGFPNFGPTLERGSPRSSVHSVIMPSARAWNAWDRKSTRLNSSH